MIGTICCRLAVLVKVLMSLAIFLSYALQFYVPVELLLPYMKTRYSLPPSSLFHVTGTVQRNLKVLTVARFSFVLQQGIVYTFD
jgi:hypothetical protein